MSCWGADDEEKPYERVWIDESDFKEDESQWDAARKLAKAKCRELRGNPPKSLAIDPVSHLPLQYAGWQFAVKSQMCPRCGEKVWMWQPHFVCADSGVCVHVECGPGVFIERDYDVYYAGEKEVYIEDKEVGHKGNIHLVRATHAEDAVWSEVLRLAYEMGTELETAEIDIDDDSWDATKLAGISPADAIDLASAAKAILAKEPTLTEAPVPAVVYGDTHGQLRDVLLYFNIYGWPGETKEYVIFNGDFVDRGKHDVELLLVFLSLKVQYPAKVFLNRGNHEEPGINDRYGFTESCKKYFGPQAGPQVLAAFQDVFAVMPLACLVADEVLTVHGGIGNGNWTLDDLRQVSRPIRTSDQMNEMVYNLLWSDPIEEDDPTEREIFGVHANPRGTRSLKFGFDVTLNFCERNELSMIVRSHSAKISGFGFDVMHDNMLIRVFSARDYGMYGNDGAILGITKKRDGVLCARPKLLKSRKKEAAELTQ